MAMFTQPPVLWKRSTVSFDSDNPHAVADFLITNGYDAEPPRSHHEYARLWLHGALVVIYANGTVLVQGDPTPSLTLLNSLCTGNTESAVLA